MIGHLKIPNLHWQVVGVSESLVTFKATPWWLVLQGWVLLVLVPTPFSKTLITVLTAPVLQHWPVALGNSGFRSSAEAQKC